MSSNEHPDMSGNPVDQPYYCDCCGKEVQEKDLIAVPNNDEVFFCSDACAESWLEKMGEFL